MDENFKGSIETENLIAREERLRKIALDLYERCKNENLTLREFDRTIEMLKIEVTQKTKI